MRYYNPFLSFCQIILKRLDKLLSKEYNTHLMSNTLYTRKFTKPRKEALIIEYRKGLVPPAPHLLRKLKQKSKEYLELQDLYRACGL